MKKVPRFILLGLHFIVLIGMGFWARHRSRVKEFEAIFAVGIFSPIRAQYPSFVSAAQEIEIQRQEHELQVQLESEANVLRVWSLVFFGSSLIPGLGAIALGRVAWKQRRTAQRGD